MHAFDTGGGIPENNPIAQITITADKSPLRGDLWPGQATGKWKTEHDSAAGCGVRPSTIE